MKEKEEIYIMAADYSARLHHGKFLTATGVSTTAAVIKGFIAGYNANPLKEQNLKQLSEIKELKDLLQKAIDNLPENAVKDFLKHELESNN